MPAILFVSLFMATSSPALTLPPEMLEVRDFKAEWMQELHHCENRDNVKRIMDSNGEYSHADFMYQMKTWLYYGKRFGATRENIYDSNLQWKVTRHVLDTVGWERDWVICGGRTEAKLGNYPGT